MGAALWPCCGADTPSEMRTSATSSSPISCSVISDLEITPTLAALWSPIERDMANPRSLCHTLAGAPLAPAGVTCPPICRMRCFSSGESGLWSVVRSTGL